MATTLTVKCRVNGSPIASEVSARELLSDFLRHRLRLTATHVGCEQGVCGACTVLLDGRAVRSCLVFAAQIDGAAIVTAEGLDPDHSFGLHEAFSRNYALQCGFCTPGFLMSAYELLGNDDLRPRTEADIRERLSGNLCRCTGYQGIVAAVGECLQASVEDQIDVDISPAR